MKPAKKIAILQTGRAPEPLRACHPDYDAMCRALIGRTEGEADTFAVLDGQFPAGLDAYDAFVITGSAHGVYEGHPWIEPLMGLIRTAVADGKKLVGICFGHQIIAQALGGIVEKSDKGLGAGRMFYDYVNEAGETRRIGLNAWHQDQVVTVPEGARVIASSDFCPVAALEYGECAISFQAHPEFSDAYVADLIRERRGTSLAEDAADRALASIKGMPDAALIADRLRRFIEA